jgi:hypothetical protein
MALFDPGFHQTQRHAIQTNYKDFIHKRDSFWDLEQRC